MYPTVMPMVGSFWLMKDLIIDLLPYLDPLTLTLSPKGRGDLLGGEGICLGARGLVRGRGDVKGR